MTVWKRPGSGSQRDDLCRRSAVTFGVLAAMLSVGTPPGTAAPRDELRAMVSDAAPSVEAGDAADIDAADGECAWEGIDDRCELWTTDGSGSRMVLSPTGDRVYTWSSGMAAHETATGTKVWDANLTGISSATVLVQGLAVSPDGRRVYAVGDDIAAGALHDEDRDIIVAAYDADTGTQVWHATVGLPGIDENDRYVSRDGVFSERNSGVGPTFAVVASPDGRRVYVTGDTLLHDRAHERRITNADVLVAGFDAATGRQEWVASWGEKYEENHGRFIAVSPDSKEVFVGGTRAPCGLGLALCPPDFLALAFRAFRPGEPAREGSLLWSALYDNGGLDLPNSMDIAPNGSRVYMTGTSSGDWATVALDGGTGDEIWQARYQGPADDRPDPLDRQYKGGDHVPKGIMASPAGDTVIVTGAFSAFLLAGAPDQFDNAVTGRSDSALSRKHDATVAYDADTGEHIWTAHLPTLTTAATPAFGQSHASPFTAGTSVVMSPDGLTVYALGSRERDATGVLDEGQVLVSYEAETGAQRWVARVPDHRPAQVAVSADGTLVLTLSIDGSIQAYGVADLGAAGGPEGR